MKKTLYLASCALLLAACSDSEEEALTYAEDAQAVHFSVSVAQLNTRAVTDADVQDDDNLTTPNYLAQGATLSLSDDGGNNYVAYKVADAAGNLVPAGTDFLKWKNSSVRTKNLLACSPEGTATAFTIPATQNTAADYAAADFLTFSGSVQRQEPNEVTFALDHRLAQVNVAIAQVKGRTEDDNKFDGATFDVQVYSAYTEVAVTYSDKGPVVTGSGDLRVIDPLSGAGMSVGTTATAVVAPTAANASARFISIQAKMGDDDLGTPMYLLGIPALESGKSYTFNLTIADDAVYISSVTVNEWVPVDAIDGGDVGDVWAVIPAMAPTNAPLLQAVAAGYQNFNIYGPINGYYWEWSYYFKNKNGVFCPEIKKVDISNLGTTIIFSTCFQDAENLEEVIMPSELREIKDKAFKNCTSLKNVKLPGTLNGMGCNVFENCTSLTSIEFPENPNFYWLLWDVCKGCTSLEEIIMHPTMTYLSDGCFEDCTALTEVELPYLTGMRDGVFKGCTSLEKLILVSLNNAGPGFVSGCTSLRKLILPKLQGLRDGLPYFDTEFDAIAPNIDLLVHQSRKDWVKTHPFKSVTYVDNDGLIVESNLSTVEVGKSYTEYDFFK